VEQVVEALDAKDYERFESYFTESTIGLQPDELWRGAFGVLAKFGKVTRLDFSRRDEASGGAFVKVQFERAVREVFVRLSREGKLRELTYVPPRTLTGRLAVAQAGGSIALRLRRPRHRRLA
jgi:hypothetical protein